VSLLAVYFLFQLPARADNRGRDKASELLAEARVATGGDHWEDIVTWHETGKITKSGLEGTFDRRLNLVGLRESAMLNLGGSSTSEGWNGSVSWLMQISGATRFTSSAEAITDAYRRAFAYWEPGRFPAKQILVGARKLGDRICEIIEIRPRSGLAFELWLDRDTHLILREIDLEGSQPRTRDFADFRERFGIKIPFTVREGTSDYREGQVTRITALEVNEVFPTDCFDPPVYMPDAGVFPPGKNFLTIPFNLWNNHIYLPVKLNGGPTKSFIFDTGGFNVLSKQEAQADGIKSEGSLAGGGAGRNTVEFGYARIDLLDVGGLVLRNQLFATFDLSVGIRFEDSPVLGLVGYEIARQAVVVIDYEKQKITFIKPAHFRRPTNAESLPLKFRQHVPTVEAVLDGVPGEFQLDTGARQSLILTRSFADEHGLLEKYHARREVIVGYGVGGPLRGLLAKAGEFKLGGLKMQAPVALISSSWRDSEATSEIAGNIGGGLLKRFTLTLDYVNGVLYLQPNKYFREPDVFDRSGLWLMRADDDSAFEISDVVPDSPASKAGLQAGEKILKADQTPASALTVATLRKRLEKEPGTKIDLEIQGEDGTRTVELVLEDLY
jgi:hypothetical protein